jgi:hypothetical protein
VKHKLQRLSNLHKSEALKHSRFSRANLVVFAVIFASIGGYLIYSSFAATATCTGADVTTSTFAARVNGAAAGDVLCLTSGNYGTWAGTNMAITITAQVGASPSLSVALGNGDANFTIDGGHTNLDPSTPGINMGPSTFTQTPGPQNITIKNVAVTGTSLGGIFEFDGPTNSNIVLDHNVWHDTTNVSTEANIRFSYDGPSGVTIKNNLFKNSVGDGVKVGASQTKILNNEFVDIYPQGHSELHTDVIQLCCGYSGSTGSGGITIIGNYVHGGCEQGIGAFDGTGGNDIENNIEIGCTTHSMVLGGDVPGSIVAHNTVWGGSTATLNCSSKAGASPSKTSLRDNIASGGTELAGAVNCQPTQNTKNLFSGATSPNINGNPIFVGGTNPTTIAGFALAANSPGKNAATDGKDVGADVTLVGPDAGSGINPTPPPPPPPPDPTPPTVSVTAPTSGATVSGASVTLSANASDNVGVVGVQFKVDGNDAGAEDTTSPYSVTWDSRTATNGIHTITAVARDAAGNSTTSSSVSITTNNTTSCSTSSTAWANNSFASQTGSFTFDFDATPSATGIDSLTGLSSGAATDFTSLAAAVRFSNTGVIEARNGGAYAAVNSLAYVAGTSYHFKLTVNVATHTYSVTVTPSGGAATTIATNYAFRTEQASIANLNNWATNSVAGSQSTCAATLNLSTGPKPGDINNDNSVNITDLSLLLSSYNQNTTQCTTNNTYKCDLSSPGDGVVNIFDLSILLSHYGT